MAWSTHDMDACIYGVYMTFHADLVGRSLCKTLTPKKKKVSALPSSNKPSPSNCNEDWRNLLLWTRPSSASQEMASSTKFRKKWPPTEIGFGELDVGGDLPEETKIGGDLPHRGHHRRYITEPRPSSFLLSPNLRSR